MVRSNVCVYVTLLLVCCTLPMCAQESPALAPLTGTGTPNHITKWKTTTTIGDSAIFETATGNVGIGTITPATKFDLKGTGAIRDTLTLFPSGVHPTLSISGTVFSISSTGKVTFVAGQTFPGTGSVTSVGSGAGLTGGPITHSGTLSIKTAGVTNAMLQNSSLKVNAGTGLSGGGTVALGGAVALKVDPTVVPELALANFFTANQFINGYLDAFPNGNNVALYGFNTSTDSTTPTLYLSNGDSTSAGDLVLDALGSSFGGECSVDVSGNLFCSGTIAAAAKVPNNRRIGLYGVQSAENWVEDFGAGQLNGGVAVVNLDRHFAQTVSADANYHVFITPAGDCEGLYVTNRTATSFEVRELKNGRSSVAFDYRIVIHRKGFESARLPDVTRRFGNKVVPPHQTALAQR